jgi:colicin import membrane protein
VNDRLKLSVFFAVCGVGTIVGSPAQAHPEVLARLMEHGELSAVEAKVLVKAVSKRMQRAASPRARKDKMRVTVARALHEQHATSRRGRERVAIRLRAGLDMWALNHLFSPETYSRANCQRQFKLSDNLCASLAAASSAGSRSQQARGAGSAPRSGEATGRARVAAAVPASEAAPVAPRPLTARERAAQRKADAAAKRRLAKETKREAALAKRERAREKRLLAKQHKRELAAAKAEAKQQRLDAERQRRSDAAAAQAKREQEKRDAIVRQREAVAAARAERERERQAAIQRKRDEAERVERERREAIQAERDRIEVARRKAEYQKQRDAYLERQREQLAERKARAVASAEGAKVQRGPASQLEAQLIGLAPQDAAADEPSGKGNKGVKAKPGSGSAASKASAGLPNGLDMVDDLVAEEPSAKRVARR